MLVTRHMEKTQIHKFKVMVLTKGNFFASNVAYVDDLKRNLISLAQLTDTNRRVEFYKMHSYVMIEDKKECLIK